MTANNFKLVNHGGGYPDEVVSGTVQNRGGALGISLDGFESATGDPEIIWLEYYQGEILLHVWSDNDEEDPTHTINLEFAQEQR